MWIRRSGARRTWLLRALEGLHPWVIAPYIATLEDDDRSLEPAAFGIAAAHTMQISRKEHNGNLCATGHVDRPSDRELADRRVRRGPQRHPTRIRLAVAVRQQRERLVYPPTDSW